MAENPRYSNHSSPIVAVYINSEISLVYSPERQTATSSKRKSRKEGRKPPRSREVDSSRSRRPRYDSALAASGFGRPRFDPLRRPGLPPWFLASVTLAAGGFGRPRFDPLRCPGLLPWFPASVTKLLLLLTFAINCFS